MLTNYHDSIRSVGIINILTPSLNSFCNKTIIPGLAKKLLSGVIFFCIRLLNWFLELHLFIS